MLLTESNIPFKISIESIKFLHTNGVVKKNEKGHVEFWVPLYKKCLYDAFYPFSNGEDELAIRNLHYNKLYQQDGTLNFDLLIKNYKDYVRKRSFKYFRVKDKQTGTYLSIKESVLAHSFETYIQTLVQAVGGKSYLEPNTGPGRCDMIININNKESVIEFKVYRDLIRFEKGKKQLSYYAESIGLKKAVYLVFVPNTVILQEIRDDKKEINGVMIHTFVILYDEEKDF